MAPKVLFICAVGRSGSTVLGNVLGELEGWCSVGELGHLLMAAGGKRRCGCGEPLERCDFWTGVRKRVARSSPLSEEAALGFERRLLPVRPRMIIGISRERESDASGEWSAYGARMRSVYEAIGAESGARVIVDASKGFQQAYATARFSGVDLRLVHLVRDPRAVAYSWRYRPRPGYPIIGDPAPMSRMIFRWVARNSLARALLRRRLGDRYTVLRYEDFAADPAATVARLCEFGGEAAQEIPGLGRGEIEFGVHHTAAGNPARMARGRTRIEPDLEWQREMSRPAKAATTIATLPMLLRYGFPIRA